MVVMWGEVWGWTGKRWILGGFPGSFPSICIVLLLKEIGSKYDKVLEHNRAES